MSERTQAATVLDILRRWLDRNRFSIGQGTGPDVRCPEETRTAIESQLHQNAAPLALRSVHLESPGWVEVVQSLNPLKVVENLITRWRHENSLRIKQADAAESARRHDELERQKVMMAYQLELLKQLNPQFREDIYAPQLLEISMDSTRALAAESRLKHVKVVELDQ